MTGSTIHILNMNRNVKVSYTDVDLMVEHTSKVMSDAQLGPEKEIEYSRNSEPDGTSTVDASTSQAASHASSNACTVTTMMLCAATYDWRHLSSPLWRWKRYVGRHLFF
ncbi:hypothetical protein Ancab_004030 [Ancistrocladus abbreviatus]